MTGPSSERTADADVALVDALYALSTLLADQGLPGSPLTKQAADRLAALVAQHEDERESENDRVGAELGWDGATTALERLQSEHEALVAQHRDTQEALAELVALKDGPRDADYERRKPLARDGADT